MPLCGLQHPTPQVVTIAARNVRFAGKADIALNCHDVCF